MKYKVLTILTSLLLFFILPMNVFAEDFTVTSVADYQVFEWDLGSPCHSINSYVMTYPGHNQASNLFACEPTFGTSSDLISDGQYYIMAAIGGQSFTSQVFTVENGSFTYTEPTPTPTPAEVKIVASPSNGTKAVGEPFNVDIVIEDDGEAFNAVRADVFISNMIVLGLHTPSSNACNLEYTKRPIASKPSFAGAIFGNSSTGCKIYTLTLLADQEGTGTITFNNASIKAYSDNSEILTGAEDASFILSNEITPTPLLEFQVTNPVLTYKLNFDLMGNKLTSITKMFVNGSDTSTVYPTSTTWQVPVTLNLGENNFTIYGKDEAENQTATQAVTVNRHILGDINGDGNINLIDASLFAVDWDKTEDLTYVLSDLNDDALVNLTDLSILAKLQ